MYELPKSIVVGKVSYKIRKDGDYRLILDVISVMQRNDMNQIEKAFAMLNLFYADANVEYPEQIYWLFEDFEAAFDAMMNFIECGKKAIGHRTSYKLIDWEQDESLIVSAINGVANTEIRALPYLHWWTFISYYMAVGDCALANIVSIRDKVARGKKLEKYEQEFKRNNPEYFIWKNQVENDMSFIKSIWNQGGE